MCEEKTMTKDIILLCKGWYDQEKYPTVLDALKQYYRKNYCYGKHDMDEQLNERFIFRVLLIEAMREITKEYPDRLIGFMNGYLTDVQLLFIPDENNNDYDYQMYHRIKTFLARLPMRGDGWIEIDTSAYFNEVTDENGEKRKKIFEDIVY